MNRFSLLILTVLVGLNCACGQKPEPLNPILDDCSLDAVMGKSLRIQSLLDGALRHERNGNTAAAARNWRQARDEYYVFHHFYLPLENAKIRIAQAARRHALKDAAGAEAEMTSVRLILLDVRSKMTGRNIRGIDPLLTDTEDLEKDIRTLKRGTDRFSALVSVIDSLVSN
ncbi:MAG: hypothetical protein QUS35_11990 [bacterium]|nr:hypothetical protein [bacterium]